MIAGFGIARCVAARIAGGFVATVVALVGLLVGAPAAVAATGAISGAVTDVGSHSPVVSVCVGAIDASNVFVGGSVTGPDGQYTISNLAPGTYRVGFQDCGGRGYVPQYYDGKPTLQTADGVSVADGGTTSGINAVLTMGTKITGTVTDAVTGDPVVGECVTAVDANGQYISGTTTGPSGTYTILSLQPGSYKVKFAGCYGSSYLPQFYNGKSTLATADPVEVSEGGTAAGINAALEPGGRISGTVTDASTGDPIANVCVEGYDAQQPGPVVATALTSTTGQYTLSGLMTGSYKVSFRNCGTGSYASEFYDNQQSLTTADSVSVTTGLTTTGIDAALEPAGAIAGTVTDAVSNAPALGICVRAFDATNDNMVTFAYADATGHYTMSPLSAGSYKVNFEPCGGDYVRQFYDNKPSLATADPVSVAAGETTSGIDAKLQPSGKITGTVTSAASGGPVANACVEVFDANDASSGFASTNTAGQYTVWGLGTGSYKVGFRSCGGGDYAPQFYLNRSTLGAADPVSVTAGATTTGIDAALAPGGRITGTVTDAVTHAPVVSACVGALDTPDHIITYAFTDATGSYTLNGLATGSYAVGFESRGTHCSTGPEGYAPQFYNDKTTFETADPVAVTAGGTRSGIDAHLHSSIIRTLTISLAGTGFGKVIGDGIDCPATCSNSYPSGESATLHVSPAAGSTFTGWSGGGCSGTGDCTVTMGSDQTVTATFSLIAKPTVTIAVPSDGAIYARNRVVVASYSCEAAAGATLTSCSGPVQSGQRIDTHTLGLHTFTVTATDNLGSTTSTSVRYTVIRKHGRVWCTHRSAPASRCRPQPHPRSDAAR